MAVDKFLDVQKLPPFKVYELLLPISVGEEILLAAAENTRIVAKAGLPLYFIAKWNRRHISSQNWLQLGKGRDIFTLKALEGNSSKLELIMCSSFMVLFTPKKANSSITSKGVCSIRNNRSFSLYNRLPKSLPGTTNVFN